MIGRLIPGRRELVDAGLLFALGIVAFLGFGTTFAGSAYLVVSAIGLLIGILVEHLCHAFKLPAVVTAAFLVVAFFVFGGVVALRSDAAAPNPLPIPATLAELMRGLVHGWKELLTTLPPVDGSGGLLVLPFVLSLACGGLGFALALRTKHSGTPVLAPLATAIGVVLLGVSAMSTLSITLRALLFTVLAVAWATIRGQRRIVQTKAGLSARLITGAALLALCGLGVAAAGLYLPSQSQQRLVIRDKITPPLDISAFPSPLSGFRKYTAPSKSLYDKTLFNVSGLPSGTPVRIATMDDYTGTAWAVSNDPGSDDTFLRVGATIPSVESGRDVTAQVTISPSYADAVDTRSWLPGAGSITKIDFTGPNQATHSDSLRFNLATDVGIVPEGMASGDSYTFTAVLGSSSIPSNAQPFGGSSLDSSSYQFVVPETTKWSATGGSAWQRMLSLAKYLQSHGAYTDGGPGEGQFLPGHGEGRLTSFLGGKQLAGDDEQYAAAFALMVNDIGLPARVVLGAVPESNGAVKGKDVHAWVEVHIADGQWIRIPQTMFMPPKSRTPDKVSQDEVADANSAVVPPPNAARPPSSLDQYSQEDTSSSRNRAHGPTSDTGWSLPAWAATGLKWGGPPIGLVLLVCGSIIGAKTLRRRRRRTAGSPTARIASGWAEIIEHARDLGADVSLSHTRRQQAAALHESLGETGGQPPAYSLTRLAETADEGVFAPTPPSGEATQDYWSDVQATRLQMAKSSGRWQRIKALVNPRSLLPSR